MARHCPPFCSDERRRAGDNTVSHSPLHHWLYSRIFWDQQYWIRWGWIRWSVSHLNRSTSIWFSGHLGFYQGNSATKRCNICHTREGYRDHPIRTSEISWHLDSDNFPYPVLDNMERGQWSAWAPYIPGDQYGRLFLITPGRRSSSLEELGYQACMSGRSISCCSFSHQGPRTQTRKVIIKE